MLPPQDKDSYISDVSVKSSCEKITGMIYKSDQNWSLWIGGQKYTSSHIKGNSFQIEGVTNQEIKIAFEKNIKSFSLYDSFDIVTGELCD